MMGILNSAEVIVIIIIAAVIIFGAKKIPEIARSLGKASTEYERSRIQAKKEIELIRSGNNSNNNIQNDFATTIKKENKIKDDDNNMYDLAL